MTARRGKRQAALAPQIEEESQGLTASPLRILILCIAVLVISASGGVLIGSVLNKAEEKPLMEMVSALVLPETTNNAIVAIVPSPTESSILAEESPFASNDYPKDATPETHVAALTSKDLETGVAALNPEPFPSKVQTPEDPAKLDPPWRKYAALAPPFDDKPLIALVIDDVGLSQDRVEELSSLPGIMTLAFLPYATKLQAKAEYARARGHEIMLHMPMEPLDQSTNPGPDALLLDLSSEELTRRVKKNLDSFEGYVGVNNHMGSRFTANSEAMSVVMDILAARGLLFLDSKTTAASVGYRFAVSRGMPSAKRDIFIDNVIDEAAILKQLQKVEDISSRKGLAIAIGHPHKATMSALRSWLPEARKRGFIFVPISAVMALKFDG